VTGATMRSVCWSTASIQPNKRLSTRSQRPTATPCGNVKAAETLVELEKAGWIEVTRAGAFAGARPSTLYRLTKYDCSVTGDPASHAYLTAFVPPRRVLKRNPTGANQKLAGFCQSSQQVPDSSGEAPDNAPVPITDALRKSLMRKGLIPRARVKTG
jgi:hypothetical protein